MTIRVSYSALECFEQCSERYRLRYKEKLITDKIASPLFFGTAIDNAIEILLLSKKVKLSDKELDLLLNEDAFSIFTKCMREQNGILLESSILCEYFLSDYDKTVLVNEDYSYLTKKYPKIKNWDSFFIECKKQIKSNLELSSDILKAYNNLLWLSLYKKGLLLIEAYKKDILPQIKEVFDIQKTVELSNESNDILVGKIDFIASFVDDPDTIYIVDNKTSSKTYSDDSVKTSIQLAIYCESENTNKASYAVMEKKLRVNEPRARTKLIKDEIPEEQFKKVFDKIENQLNNISKQEFEKKNNPKDCFFFGRKCEFFDLCWKGISNGLKSKGDGNL